MSIEDDVYVKSIGHDLDVCLQYVDKNESEVGCILTFHNKSDGDITVNPSRSSDQTQDIPPTTNGGDNGWFSGIWGGSQPSRDPSGPSNGETHLFLGYIQLLGYITLNYSFGLDDRSDIAISDKPPRNSTWWVNNEYLDNYNEGSDDMYDRNEQLYTVPFILDSVQHPMVIGGKLGGVNDLVMEDEKNSRITIDSKQRYLLQDLVYDFNSYKPPKTGDNIDNDGKVPLKDLTDSIVPFYSTGQSLLFSDLSLKPRSSRSYRFTFPNIQNGPPSYNSNSTGITGEQGLISIRYSLILGFSKLDESSKLAPMSIYYPFNVVGDRKGRDERWLQPNYLQHVTIDKSWKVKVIKDQVPDRKSSIASEKNPHDMGSEDDDKVEDIDDNKRMFLEDLDNLINSDLQNIPKISSKDRKKSVSSVFDSESSKQGLMPQLPARMKNQFQILVNSNRLCFLKVSKPYYHIGEDLVFNIELDNQTTDKNKFPDRAVGLSAHIEAHEIFHLDGDKTYINIYKVTPDMKFNSFATSMLASHTNNSYRSNSFINGYLNIPNFLSQQFQCSKLMDLKYFVVFKFNLFAFDKEEGVSIPDSQRPSTENGSSEPSTALESHEQPNGNVSNGAKHSEEAAAPLMEELHIDSAGTAKSQNTEPNSHGTSEQYRFINNYKFNNVGTDFRFRLPISILP